MGPSEVSKQIATGIIMAAWFKTDSRRQGLTESLEWKTLSAGKRAGITIHKF
jgi:hypothetical protein